MGHPRVVPVLGVEEGVVSLEGVGAWQVVVLVLQSSRVVGCVSGVGVGISVALVAS